LPPLAAAYTGRVELLDWDDRPALRDPVVVCAFRGWNDGGQAATLSATFLRERLDAQRFCRIDPEEFYDFQEERPQVALAEGVQRQIQWPENAFHHAPLPGQERDLVVLLGIEPQNRWRTFSGAVLDVAQAIRASLVITLGGLLAETPHSRPVPVTGTADPDIASRLGLTTSRYEGPTGIVGVLHDRCRTAGVSSASLWAAVPHYVSIAPNPKAALALLSRLSGLLSARFDTTELAQAAIAYEREVGRAVAQDDEVADYVRQLEARADTLGSGLADLPTGDLLAAEFEAFLAQQPEDDPPAD
jgi:proteasome assembly chaperone (PAC2) family protein